METSIRHVVLLSLLPREPARIDAKLLCFELAARGFPVDVRTVQRDLIHLSRTFPIVCTHGTKPIGWSWQRNAPPLGTGALDPAMALALVIAGGAGLLPTSLERALAPMATAARKYLDHPRGRPVGAFSRRFRMRLGTAPADAPPSIPARVLEATTRAVCEGRRLAARYHRADVATSAFVLDPLGLVWDGGALRLVARGVLDPAPRWFALARVKSAKVLDDVVDDRGFDLDAFLTAGVGARVALVIRVRGEALPALEDAPLSPDQVIETLGEDEARVRAAAEETPALIGRLLALGGDAVVEAPAELAAVVVERARAVVGRYVEN
jgi:predicted DNA-binding transcriptional regulator YafY